MLGANNVRILATTSAHHRFEIASSLHGIYEQLQRFDRIGSASSGPLDEFDGITPSTACLHAMNGVLGYAQPMSQLALGEAALRAEFDQQRRNDPIGSAHLRLGHTHTLDQITLDNVLWSN